MLRTLTSKLSGSPPPGAEKCLSHKILSFPFNKSKNFCSSLAFELVQSIKNKTKKEELKISQSILNKEKFISTCKEKSKDVIDYYRILSDICFISDDLIKSYDEKSMKQFELHKQDLHKLIVKLQSKKRLGWIETALADLDKRLEYLAQKDKNKRKDLSDEEIRIMEAAKGFKNQYMVLETYKDFFSRYFKLMIDKVN